MGQQWTEQDFLTLRKLWKSGAGVERIAHDMKRTPLGVRNKVYSERLNREPISISPARKWDDNLTVQGDALIISDMETPYHHSEFVNKCIDLALSWNIKQIILAGDFVHFANYSHWAENFKPKRLSAAEDEGILKIINMLPDDKRDAAIAEAERCGIIGPEDGISAEIHSVRKTVKELEGAFENIVYIMGNHEQRKLRKQDYGEDPAELLTFFEADKDKWQVSPFYWCNLQTSNTFSYRIEHPIAAGRTTAQDLAVQYQQHIIMGHSHRWALNRDPSGRLYAIQAGHAVDEMRLSYVQQRSAKRDAHALGAVIVRNGYPFLLEINTPWEMMKRV